MAGRYDLYNGNIGSMVTTLSKIDTIVPSGLAAVPVAVPQGNAYKYDQLNRITESKTFCNIDIPNNQWLSSDQFITNMYTNNFTYEANGNILTQTRYDNLGVQHDDMVYKYWKDASGDMIHNRLYHVNDDTAYTSLRSDDIDDQGSFSNHEDSINVYNNYSYDAIGNLVKDSTEEIDSIEWTVYGKIKRITRVTGSTKDNLAFDYDASGNRVAKHISDNSNQWKRTTYYVRDAQGNVMSTYEHTVDDTVLSYAQTEKHLYGSSRLGMDAQPNELIGATASISGDPLTHYQGFKRYELSNHLGNVMTTLTDHKIAVDTNSNDTIDFYLADIMSQYDYYPFGAPMSERSYVFSKGYRYGFNGKEKDDEEKGEGASYDYGNRVYDTRLGKFLSVDPLADKFGMLTPYQYASNCPISGIDLDGLEYYYAADGTLIGVIEGSTEVRLVDSKNVKAVTSTIQSNNFQIKLMEQSGKKADYDASVKFKNEADKLSTPVGMNNDELNLRAFMSTLKQTENGGNEPLDYNDKHWTKSEGLKKFTGKSYDDAPEDYATHPYAGKDGGTAAGAYQILYGTYKLFIKAYEGIDNNFSPETQDKITLAIISEVKSLDNVKNGELAAAVKKLTAKPVQYASLPGGGQEAAGMTMDKVKKLFKANLVNELAGKSNISIPKGKLMENIPKRK